MPEGFQAVHSRLYRSRGYARAHKCIGCGRQALDWAYQYSAGDSECGYVSNAGTVARHQKKLHHEGREGL